MGVILGIFLQLRGEGRVREVRAIFYERFGFGQYHETKNSRMDLKYSSIP